MPSQCVFDHDVKNSSALKSDRSKEADHNDSVLDVGSYALVITATT